MRKRTKTLCIKFLCSTILFANMVCYADNKFDSVRPEELTKDELVDAYNELRDSYNEVTSTEKDVDSEENQANNWIVKNYVDEFGLQTKEQYITNEYYIFGVFSNSATTDSDLKVQFVVDKDDASIILYEYGDNKVNNYYSSKKYYSLSALDSKGEKHSISCHMNPKGENLWIGDKDEFCRILEHGGDVSFYIKEDDGMSKYKFTVNFQEGFSRIYSEIGGDFQSTEEYQKYLQEEEDKHINGEIEILLRPKDQLDLECVISSEIPDGTVIELLLFKNHHLIDEIKQEIKNGEISYTFEGKLEDTVSGDEFEVDTKLVYQEQSEEIQQKLGKGAFQEFFYLDGVDGKYANGQKIATLGYTTYIVE